jgi:hypothetical protein
MSSYRSGPGGTRTEQACGERRYRPVGDLHHDSVVGVRTRAAEVEAGDTGRPDHEPHHEHRRGDADRERGAANEAGAFAVSQASLVVHGVGRRWVGIGTPTVCVTEVTTVVALAATAATTSAAGLIGGTCEATV